MKRTVYPWRTAHRSLCVSCDFILSEPLEYNVLSIFGRLCYKIGHGGEPLASSGLKPCAFECASPWATLPQPPNHAYCPVTIDLVEFSNVVAVQRRSIPIGEESVCACSALPIDTFFCPICSPVSSPYYQLAYTRSRMWGFFLKVFCSSMTSTYGVWWVLDNLSYQQKRSWSMGCYRYCSFCNPHTSFLLEKNSSGRLFIMTFSTAPQGNEQELCYHCTPNDWHHSLQIATIAGSVDAW